MRKEKRPRRVHVVAETVIHDPLEFTKNNCSPNARMVLTKAESIEFDIWFDKHYYSRERHGDDDGAREGIEPDTVQDLIVLAARHLLYYTIKVKSFSFVNFGTPSRPERIILTQRSLESEALNLIVEYHYLSLSRYEVTLKTAMRKDDFTYGDGQYQILIEVDGMSSLSRSERGAIKTIEQYDG